MSGMRVTLFAPLTVVPRRRTATLIGVLKVPETATVTESILAAWGPGGVITVNDAFGLRPGSEVGPGVVSALRETIFLPTTGWHELRWSLNTTSALAEVLVLGEGDQHAEPHDLDVIPVIGHVGVDHEPDLMVRFTNSDESAVDVREALFASALVVAGEEHPHVAGNWDGWTELPPGASTWRAVSLQEYGLTRDAVPTAVRMRYAGQLSRPVMLHD